MGSSAGDAPPWGESASRPTAGGRIVHAAAFAAAALLLLSACLVNGYPLLFPDSGNYLALAIVAEELPYRTLVYGALLTVLGAAWTLWFTVAFQSAVVVWLLDQTVALFVERNRPAWLLAMAAALTLFTGLPWYVGQIMPDVFSGALILALVLLIVFGDRLPPWRRLMLTATVTIGTAIHASHLPVALALLVAGLVALKLMRRPLKAAALPGLAIALGLASIPAVHYAETGRAYLNKGGELFLFARLVEDGIVGRYLNENCPLPDTVLCAFRDQLPSTHNGYLWDDRQAFDMAGGWEQSGPESQRIMWATLRHYPGMHALTALRSFARQMVLMRTGDYLRTAFLHNTTVIEIMLPWEAGAYHNALQQRRQLRFFDALNLLHVPLQLGACAALAGLGLLAWRRADRRTAGFALLLLVGLMANAFTCGTLSNPQDRYQSRVVWIAVLGAGLMAGPPALSAWRRRRTNDRGS